MLKQYSFYFMSRNGDRQRLPFTGDLLEGTVQARQRALALANEHDRPVAFRRTR